MSIADKLKTVAQKMEDVYRTGLFKYAPKATASGESILLENSAPEPFVNMIAYGHSWQNGTPTPSTPIEIESAKEVKVLGGNTEQTLTLPTLREGDVAYYSKKKITLNSKVVRLADYQWVMGNANYDGDGMTFYIADMTPLKTNGDFCLITHFNNHGAVIAWESCKLGEFMFDVLTFVVCTSHSTLDEFMEWLSAENVEAVISIAEPIETDLTDEQIYAFKRLRANSPNTTIVGQGQVDVTYIVDNR